MPKILCLPGFATNKKIMKYQLRNFIKQFPDFEFVIMDAFYEISRHILKSTASLMNMLPEDEKVYSWLPFDQPAYLELPSSLNRFVDFVNETGPYDGMLGFSQGGRILHLFITELEEGKIKLNFAPPKFFIFVCGYASYELTEIKFSVKLSESRTVHLLCKKDPLFMAEKLMTMKYFDPLVLDFDQEHKIPHIDAESYKMIQKYITNAMKNNKISKNNKIRAAL